MSERSGPQGRGASFARGCKDRASQRTLCAAKGNASGSPFLCLLSFGEAKESRSPAGARPGLVEKASASNYQTGLSCDALRYLSANGLRRASASTGSARTGLGGQALRQAQRERVFRIACFHAVCFDKLSTNGLAGRALRYLSANGLGEWVLADSASTSSARTGWWHERFDGLGASGFRVQCASIPQPLRAAQGDRAGFDTSARTGWNGRALRQAQRERAGGTGASAGSARTGALSNALRYLSANGLGQRALRQAQRDRGGGTSASAGSARSGWRHDRFGGLSAIGSC